MFKPAERKKAKLRLGISGPAGSGKTVSALLIAYGITNDWSKIALVDTEAGSGELYAGTTIGETDISQYHVATITPPFEPQKYISAIKAAENSGFEVVILDSISHAWMGEGGLLDTQGKVAARIGNSYAAWREVTPLHNQFVEAMLQSKIHVIATMRSKQEFVQEKDEKSGKSIVRKLGMAPIQRDGMDYEFTVVFDLSHEHIAAASKDRTSIFDGKYFLPTQETGKLLKEWLDVGAPTSKKEAEAPTAPAAPAEPPAEDEPPKETPTEPSGETKESPKSEKFILLLTEKPVLKGKTYTAQAVLYYPESENPITFKAPQKFGEILTSAEGRALEVTGKLKDDTLTATSVKIHEDKTEANGTEIGEAGDVVVLTSAPKDGKVPYKGEVIIRPWASCKYKNTEALVVGNALKTHKQGDMLNITIADRIEKDDKLMIFVSEANKIEQKIS